MATITDIIDLIHPASDSMGNILSNTVWVLFDAEIDEASIDNGNFLVEGPDTDSFIGPDMGLHLPNVSDSYNDDQLNSPGYAGIVPGAITFQRINLLDTDVYTGPDDIEGVGNLWRTKAIFTPTYPFQKLTEYKVYLAGDELPDDTAPTGIRSRTVFDPVADPGNTGSGVIQFGGTYTGGADNVFNVRVTMGGAPGELWYEWWRDTDEGGFGPILSDAYGSQELANGVTIKFLSGAFEENDTFTAVVKMPTVFTDNTYWLFTTGSGAIQTMPTSVSTSITGSPMSLIPVSLTVTSAIPKDRATNLPITTKKITLTFSANIDPTTVTSETVLLTASPVNGDEELLVTRDIKKDITVTGNKIILDF